MLASHEDELDGSRLPPVLRPDEPAEPRLRRRRLPAGLTAIAPMAAKIALRSRSSPGCCWDAGAPGAALLAAVLCAPSDAGPAAHAER